MVSSARTIYITPAPPGGTGPNGSINGNVPDVWPAKQPGDALDFTVDLSSFLADAAPGGDTINPATVAITCTPSDLTYGTPTVTSTAITWVFSGGEITNPLTAYQVMLSLVTTGGLTVTRQLFLPIAPSTPLPGSGGYVWLVQGPPGEAGGFGTLQAGTVTTLASGASNTASIRTPSPGISYLDLGIAPGPAGGQGIGIQTITQPAGPQTAVVTLYDPVQQQTSTATLTLPSGAAGQNGQNGAAGAPGAAGTVLPAIISLGNFNPATNTSPALTNGGQANGASIAPGYGFYASAAGTLVLDGQTMVFTPGDAVGVSANQTWYYQAGAYGSGVIPTITIPQSRRLYEDNYNDGVSYVLDTFGAVLESSGAGTNTNTGTMLFNVVSANTYLNLPASALPAAIEATSSFGLIGTSNRYNDNYPDGNDYEVDAFGAVLRIIAATGSTFPGNITIGGTLNASGIGNAGFFQADYNAAAARMAAQNSADSIPFPCQPLSASTYNLAFSCGPSESLGTEAIPALSQTGLPQGLLSIGSAGATRGTATNINASNIGTFAPLGGTAFSTTQATNQDGSNSGGGTIATIPTGSLTITNCITTVSGHTLTVNGTFSASPTSVFSAGQAQFLQGFTGAVANNYNAPGAKNQSNYFTFSAGTSTSMTLVAQGLTPAATTAAEGPILATMYSVPLGYLGEDPILTAAADLRTAQLRNMGKVADATTNIIVQNMGVGNQTLAAFLPGGSPNLFTPIQQMMARVASNAGSLGGSASCGLVLILGGGPEYNSGANAATIMANDLALVDAINTQVKTTFGAAQAKLPAIGKNVYFGPTLNDYDTSGSYAYANMMPDANATLAMCGMAPAITGTTAPMRANLFCVGNGMMGITHSQHFDANGGIAYGAQCAKISAPIVLGSPTIRRPPYIVSALIRGNQILVSVAGVIGSLVNRYVFNQGPLVSIANMGLAVVDSTVPITLGTGPNSSRYSFWGGGLAMANAPVFVGPTEILITLVNTPTGNNLALFNGSQATAQGLSSLADADSTVSSRLFYFNAGDGQSPFNNLTGAVGLTQPQQTGAPMNTFQVVQPCAIPIVAG